MLTGGWWGDGGDRGGGDDDGGEGDGGEELGEVRRLGSLVAGDEGRRGARVTVKMERGVDRELDGGEREASGARERRRGASAGVGGERERREEERARELGFYSRPGLTGGERAVLEPAVQHSATEGGSGRR